ncbi:MAG: tripartite tricarboxylate transporter substrate binding protein [Hydrogenophaga sp.]|jgi:tripartite-type tricarboxylate transporter receptor subunit TctC|uniref:Bug family tripartite tricarboxylate transporter substrate binding protein n=1 Tax=Hydrogenophaga sp. TaxID=1904254 RepID=UPI00261DE713|nr:tripartite tricarboxylate transporter substrate binding protein [Hydrogenophaga sp.]MCW5672328.1 tripartite tricarboxylate transporter substrate binding protein [Hydrogenophaga sp.]
MTHRRTLLALTSLLALLGTSTAHAQTAAEKQLAADKFTLVAPFPAGGPIDTLARVLADGLGKRYNQIAVVDNAPGAAGNIGMERVKRAKPDGHTLLVIPAGNLTVNPTLMPKFPFDIQKDFVPVAMLAKTPNVLVTNPATGIKSVADLIARAKAKPDSLSYASPGVGSGLHLAGELFKSQADVDILHIAYKGTPPAINDVLGGTVPLMFSNLPTVLPHIRSGKLVALAVTDSARTPTAPEIPTLGELGVPGVVVPSWYGLLAPAGTPADVVAQLARDAAVILAEPAVRERLQGQGLSAWDIQTTAFDAHIRDETARWAKVIKARNITME